MPRRPSPKNLKNPLRLLRALCSEPAQAPITQIRLAQITGIAPDHVRNLENSRRPLNRAQLDKILYSIGAKWDLKRKTWMVNGIPDEPFTYTWFQRYRTLWTNHGRNGADKETHMLCRRLQALLQGVEPSDYNLVFDRIYHALEEIRSELKVGAAKSVFDKTAFKIVFACDPKTGEIESIHRSFYLADEEIRRHDSDNGHFGYLDLTPYSYSRPLFMRDMLSGKVKLLDTVVTDPEHFHEIKEKIRVQEQQPDA